jgi:hypothetical protein
LVFASRLGDAIFLDAEASNGGFEIKETGSYPTPVLAENSIRRAGQL